jgi:hypothetical protein
MSTIEDCAKIAEQCARGQALEIAGRTLPLGSMMMDPVAAQQATAMAIAAAIRATLTMRNLPDD